MVGARGVGLATEKSPGSLVHLPRADPGRRKRESHQGRSLVPSPERYQGTCLRPKAQARETSGSWEERGGRAACGGNLEGATENSHGGDPWHPPQTSNP